MFEESVKLFSTSTGFQHPSPNLTSKVFTKDRDSSTECDVLHLVVKTKSSCVCRKAHYRPTEFTLPMILDPPKELDVPLDFKAFVTESLKSKKSVKGKLSTELADLDLELSGNDYVNLECNFGKVNRKRVNRPQLLASLNNRRVNFNHDLVQQISQNRKKSFCLVIESAVTTEDVPITLTKGKELNQSSDLSLKLKKKCVCMISHCAPDILMCVPCAKLWCKSTPTQEFKLEAGLGITNEAIKSMIVPKGTIVAYETSELNILPDGSIKLLLSTDLRGSIMIPVFGTDGETHS